ncbi:MAG: uracil-DNA glycosylase [Elusimicrobia bacterium]|nr:uracil-DNA glycosylase [Elusimicrobiota bacterium]
MSERIKKNLIKYLEQREATGEKGFWYGPEEKSSSTSEDRAILLDDLRKKAEECRACPLGEFRLNACFGDGAYDSKLMFIGERAGDHVDHDGRVFIGRARKLLDKIIETTLGLKRSEVYVTNIVKCHPMKDPTDPDKRGNDRPPTEEELQVCINKFLFKEISIIRPKVIVTLGAPAGRTILNESRGITKFRGILRKVNFGGHEAEVIPTFHPAYLLRSPSKKREVQIDMELVKSRL